MANQELEQNQEGQEQQPNEGQEAVQTDEGVKGTETVNPETNLEEWQKDSRYGKMWNKADDLYNSYKSLENKFQDVNPKYTGLLKVLKENGFQAENLADELKKYADYKNPDSRVNQVYNYVNGYLENKLYSDRVLQFFQQLEAEELQRLYPNMSAEQIKKQQELEAKLQQLETTERQRQEEKYMADTTAQITNGLTECENLAKEYGFKMTDEVKNYLLNYCRDNNVEPRYIKSAFRDLYGKQLLEARDKKILANYTARKQKIKDAEIISGGAGKVGNFATTGDAKSKLRATFEKIMGKQ